MKILSAEHVLPIAGDPLTDGAVAFENGRIAAVGPKDELYAAYPAADREHFGRAVILPGLVNCHAHLELTLMRGFLDEHDADFAAWLLKLTRVRADDLSDEDIAAGALLGAFEGARAGVTCFGDIGRWGRAGLGALKRNGLRGILFQETEFSPDGRTAAEDFGRLRDKYDALREEETELVRAGLSPHSPYTVSRELFELIAGHALAADVPVSIHAAESDAERNLMETGSGFFADIYERENVRWETPFCSTIEFLERTGILETRPLLAHCVKVSGTDIETIRRRGARIAHCPKSNAKFGHGIAPLGSFLEREVTVGLGSDSVASNNVCDIIEEARFATLLARAGGGGAHFIEPREIIRTATLGGARALGLDDSIGSLEPGKQADLIVISLEDAAQTPVHDVHSAILFASNARDVRLTVVAGEEIFRDGVSKKLPADELKERIGGIARKMS